MTKVKKTNNATDWHGCEAPAAFTHWWLECAVYFGKQVSIFSITKHTPTLWYINATSRYLTKRNKNIGPQRFLHENSYYPQNGNKTHKCPLANELITEILDIQSTKGNELLIRATTWMTVLRHCVEQKELQVQLVRHSVMGKTFSLTSWSSTSLDAK